MGKKFERVTLFCLVRLFARLKRGHRMNSSLILAPLGRYPSDLPERRSRHICAWVAPFKKNSGTGPELRLREERRLAVMPRRQGMRGAKVTSDSRRFQ